MAEPGLILVGFFLLAVAGRGNKDYHSLLSIVSLIVIMTGIGFLPYGPPDPGFLMLFFLGLAVVEACTTGLTRISAFTAEAALFSYWIFFAFP